MTGNSDASRVGALLFARLQLSLPTGRAFLVTSPRTLTEVEAVAARLADEARTCGRKTRLLVPEEARIGPIEGLEVVKVSSAECMARERARELVAGDDYVVVARDNLLGSAEATILASTVDGVVLVAQRAHTAQHDLTDVRLELERFGGLLAGAVLLD